MTKDRRPFRPSVSDPLEPRIALSTTAAAPIAARCAEIDRGARPAPTDLNGVLTGILRTTTRLVGLEPLTTVELSGSGRVGSLGEAKVSGTVRLGGFLGFQGGGTLMLSNERGTLTLQAVGTQSNLGLLGPVPTRLQLTVVGGTGAYAQATGRGEGHLTVLGLTGYTLTLTADPSAPQASPAAERARQDLAERLGVPPKQIQLLGTERRDFPDSCLGAPEPGTVCAQVITEGYAIRLGWGGCQYEYRTPRLDNPPYLRLVQFRGRNWLIPLAFDAAPSPPTGL